jgi:hypothetical protein
MTSGWYRGLFATRLSPAKAATQEFVTTAQGCRRAAGALAGRGADIIILDDPLKPEEALSRALRIRPLQPARNLTHRPHRHYLFQARFMPRPILLGSHRRCAKGCARPGCRRSASGRDRPRRR